jgi:superfamily II DNA helicase RecQ
MDYSTTLSAAGRARVLQMFVKGETHILIATDAVRMGIDIRDVEFIIQWSATRILNHLSLFQRGGRGGRNPDIWAKAILYYSRSLLFECASSLPKDSKLNVLKNGAKSAESAKIRPLVREWRILKPQKRVADEPDILKGVERGILWFINTGGCLRDVMMDLLDSNRQPSTFPCCSFCYLRDEASCGLPFPHPFDIEDTTQFLRKKAAVTSKPLKQIIGAAKEEAKTQNPAKSGREQLTTMRRHRVIVNALKQRLRCNLRKKINEEKKKSALLPEDWFLPDSDITKLAKAYPEIVSGTIEETKKVLGGDEALRNTPIHDVVEMIDGFVRKCATVLIRLHKERTIRKQRFDAEQGSSSTEVDC